MVLNLLRHFLTQVDISYWQRIRSRECQDDGLNYREEFTQFLIWIYVYSFIVRFTEFLAMLIPCVRDIFWCWMMKLFGTGQKIVPPSWSSASDISDLINVYLNADRQSFIILKDDWGTLDIFRAADRRIGRR